jgi:flagellar hook-length control protein FliK
MNVTTIGFPFAGVPGAPALGTPGQDFALALGAAGLSAPMIQGAANDKIARPANDAAPLSLGKSQIIRTQPGTPITLAQLLTTGSTVPATVSAVQPAQIAEVAGTPVPADATAQPVTGSPVKLPDDAVAQSPAGPVVTTANPAQVPVTGKADPAAPQAPEVTQMAETPQATGTRQATEATALPDPKSAAPDPAISNPTATAQPDTNEPVACPTAAGDPPTLLDLPTAGRPANGIVPTPTVATPVKARKPLTVDRDAPALPVDPLAAQPAATPTPVVVAGTTPQPTPPVAIPEGKPAGERGTKATPVALGQPTVQAASDVMTPDAKSDKQPIAPSNDTVLPDAALPAEIAVKVDARSSAAPASPQSFAAHVAQSAAQAPVPATAPAPATPAADPMIPARAGQLGHALGVEIARKVEAGDNTLRVRLNPVELGRVEVTLAFDDRGNLRATMRAESQHALDLLRQDAPDLGRALDTAGIRADSQSFRFESRSDGNGGSTGGQTGQHQSRGNSQHAFNDEPETTAPAYRAIRNDGQVDLLA